MSIYRVTLKLSIIIVAFLSASGTWACSVCGANQGDIFIYFTVLLSFLPITIVGLIIWWFIRQHKKKARLGEK